MWIHRGHVICKRFPSEAAASELLLLWRLSEAAASVLWRLSEAAASELPMLLRFPATIMVTLENLFL